MPFVRLMMMFSGGRNSKGKYFNYEWPARPESHEN